MTQQTQYVFSDKYQPLFAPPRTRYILVKGGRGSGKSHAVSSATSCATYDDGFNILYTRFTLTSAEVSIIPEYKEKLDIFGIADDFIIKRKEIINCATGATIYFRGIMQSSKNQIAKLKSIHNVKTWILDEAQELTDEATFDTIDLSIRAVGTTNTVVIVFNPTDIDHWIYRRFYREAGVDEDFNGVRGDVTYISTTYFDNLPNLSDSFIARAEQMRALDRERYENVFLGKFARRREGIIFRNWEAIAPEEYPTQLPQWYGNDWGYSEDPNALVRMCYDPLSGIIYIWEVCYKTGMLPRDVAPVIIADAASVGLRPEEAIVYVDPSRPEARDELRIHYGIDATSAVNRDKAGRVAWLRGFRVRYVGEHIGAEVKTYSYKPKPQDNSHYTDEPCDGNDHAMDAINYAAVTHLRRLGITNNIGEN